VTDILTGIALVLIIEGLVYALAPSLVERLLETMRDMPLDARRLTGLIALGLGVGLLWVIG
jgi:uncharacterized protein YjeT (DUF2065 family)